MITMFYVLVAFLTEVFAYDIHLFVLGDFVQKVAPSSLVWCTLLLDGTVGLKSVITSSSIIQF